MDKGKDKGQDDDLTLAGPRSFAVFLARLGDGEANFELSEALHRLTDKLHDEALNAGKAKGKLTLTLAFAVGKNGQVEIERDVKVAEPKPVRGKAVAWIDRKGNLVSENPRQAKLPLRPVDAPGEAPRDVAEGSLQAMR